MKTRPTQAGNLRFFILFLLFCLTAAPIANAQPKAPAGPDPHYTEVGFFDIHVCNWPNRAPFYLTLFSTARFDDIAKVEVFLPGGRRLGELNPGKYRLVQADPKKKTPVKHVFMAQFPRPADAPEGRFSAVVTLKKSAEQYVAYDYVINRRVPRATGMVPADGDEDVPMPKRLTWAPVPGAKYYRVFIRDTFTEQTLFQSKVLATPALTLPKGLLHKGGAYAWRVHSRDVNEHADLGDFNAGSLTRWMEFSVAE